VWQFFEGNDLTDAREFLEWKRNPAQSAVSLKDRYFSNSFLTSLLIRTRLPDRSGGPLVMLRYPDGNTARIAPRYRYEPNQPETIADGLSETRQAIEAAQRLCQANGIRLVVVFVPTMVRVMEPYLSFDRREDKLRYLPEVDVKDRRDFGSHAEAFCVQLGVPFIDGLSEFRAAAAKGKPRLYVPNDEHLDVGGHEVVAEMVVSWLRSQQLVIQR
jgi:hypothetical protein